MSNRLTLLSLVLGTLLFVSGCSNRATATLSPGADLSKLKTFYVVHQPKDTHSLHNLISDKLVKEGYSATAGPELPQSSYKVDSIVTYVDRWMWDITLYLLELTVTFRDATNGFPLAVGNSYHTSLTRKSPEEMVDEVLTNILNTSKQNQTGRAVNRLIQNHLPRTQLSPPGLFLYGFVALLWGCSTPGTFEGMVPTSFQTEKNHPQTVRVNVTGGQETVALGRPQITNSAFTQALTESITKSRTFSGVIGGQSQRADYLLTVTLFSMDKLVFGRTVSMEAGWTLRRADAGTVVWQESIISEHTDADIRLATEGAARNNIAQGLRKISKLNFQFTR